MPRRCSGSSTSCSSATDSPPPRSSPARRPDRPAQHPLADHLFLLQGRQHHPAAAGAGLDRRSLRQRRRHPRLRPDHRLCRARERRPSRHLRVGRRGQEGAPGVRLQPRPDRRAAARPVRGRHDPQDGRGGQPGGDHRRLDRAVRAAHDGRHPGHRPARPRERAPLRRRAARLGDQPRPVPQPGPAVRQGVDQRPERRVAAKTQPRRVALRDLLGSQPVDAAGRSSSQRRCANSASPQRPTIPCCNGKP